MNPFSALPSKNAPLLILFIFSLIGMGMLYYATHLGIGVSPDSVAYIMASRQLSQGQGLTLISAHGGQAPLTHFPPLYPLVLSFLSLFGLKSLTAARFLQIFCFGANLFLIGSISFYFSRSIVMALMACGIFLLSSDMILYHCMALSEPLFYFFLLLSLFWLGRFLGNSNKKTLLLFSFSSGLCILTRYAGIALIATAVFCLTLFYQTSLKEKMRNLGIYIFISCLPIFIWFGRNWFLAKTTTNREFHFHMIEKKQIILGFETLLRWIYPMFTIQKNSGYLFFIIFLMGIIASFIFMRKSANLKMTFVPLKPFLVFMGLYLALILLTICFFDAYLLVNETRTLSPIFVVGLILLFTWITGIMRVTGIPRIIKPITLGFIGIIFFLYFWVALEVFPHFRQEGLGYQNRQWINSETLAYLKKGSQSIPLYSNAPDALYIHLNKKAFPLVNKFNPGTRLPNPQYEKELLKQSKEIARRKGLLVYFHQITWRKYLPSKEEFENKYLQEKMVFKDATLFGAREFWLLHKMQIPIDLYLQK